MKCSAPVKSQHANISLFLKKFQSQERSGIEFEYFLAGSGECLESLRLLATELGVDSRVRFLGRLEPEQVIDLLARCDVLIHPSPTH